MSSQSRRWRKRTQGLPVPCARGLPGWRAWCLLLASHCCCLWARPSPSLSLRGPRGSGEARVRGGCCCRGETEAQRPRVLTCGIRTGYRDSVRAHVHVCACWCARARVRACVGVCVGVRMCAHVYVCAWVCALYAGMCVQTCVCVCACVLFKHGFWGPAQTYTIRLQEWAQESDF